MAETATAAKDTIAIERVDHIGIRIGDVDAALKFYGVLGFEVHHKVEFDDVIIIKNAEDVEINLITNANDLNDGKNVLMDVDVKYPGHTHIALRIASVEDTIATLKKQNIAITQGPVSFGRDGHVSVFVRDPDRNVIELRGRAEDLSKIEGLEQYVP